MQLTLDKQLHMTSAISCLFNYPIMCVKCDIPCGRTWERHMDGCNKQVIYICWKNRSKSHKNKKWILCRFLVEFWSGNQRHEHKLFMQIIFEHEFSGCCLTPITKLESVNYLRIGMYVVHSKDI